MSNGRSTQRGAALIIVLMLVATLALGALALTETMKRAVNQSGAASARDQAVWALLGAETAALLQAIGIDREALGVHGDGVVKVLLLERLLGLLEEVV